MIASLYGNIFQSYNWLCHNTNEVQKRYNLFVEKVQSFSKKTTIWKKGCFEPTIFHAIMDFNMQSWGTIILAKNTQNKQAKNSSALPNKCLLA